MARNFSRLSLRISAGRMVVIGGKGLDDGLAGGAHHLDPVPMRAADRLGDDAVDDAEPEQVLGGDLHIGGGILARVESRHRIEAAASGEATV